MLNADQLKEINDFWRSTSARALFEKLEAGLMQDWSTAADLAAREDLWQQVQALRRLQAGLRDATADTYLTQRNVRRVYTT